MAERNLKQITDKLNAEFTGEVRHLVFWYDASSKFVDDVEGLELVNAKVYHIQKDNQFYTKHFLECIDTQTNYLIYALLEKHVDSLNHRAELVILVSVFDLVQIVIEIVVSSIHQIVASNVLLYQRIQTADRHIIAHLNDTAGVLHQEVLIKVYFAACRADFRNCFSIQFSGHILIAL